MEKESAREHVSRYRERMGKNLLTGLYFPSGFMEAAREFIGRAAPNEYCMTAIDIQHFRLFNKFHGRPAGDKLLRHIADCLEALRSRYGGVTGYFEGDNFFIILPWNTELLDRLWEDIRAGIDRLGGRGGRGSLLRGEPD